MQRKRIIGALIILGSALAGVSAMALVTTQTAEAQCGSQASSCRNCHETQGQDPVNTDGTGWHEAHAFGDFCYICHGGNSQATEAEAAHTDMVAPMSDVQAACAQCHPNDLQTRADVYNVALGVPAGSGSAPIAPASPAAAATSASASAEQPAAPVSAAAVAAPPAAPDGVDITDYVERYNREALHQSPTNWGNVILVVVLLGLLGLGLFFINKREGWISISLSEKKAASKEYSDDVLKIADQAETLSSSGRRALTRLLARPAAGDVLTALDKLSVDDPAPEKK